MTEQQIEEARAKLPEAKLGIGGNAWLNTYADALLLLLDQKEEALRKLIDVSAQYLDTERGDLDGAIDAARAALSKTEATPE